jgi:hypothetical protein
MFTISQLNISNQIKKLFTPDSIIMFTKIISIYVLTFLIFYKIENKNIRLIFTSLIYLFCIHLFNIDINMAIFYIFIAIGCAVTESIYITFCKDTWNYRNPDIINIPYWLIPLWSVAFLLIIETVNILK